MKTIKHFFDFSRYAPTGDLHHVPPRMRFLPPVMFDILFLILFVTLLVTAIKFLATLKSSG